MQSNELTQTVVLSGAGPHVKVKLNGPTRVMVVSKGKVKTVELNKTADLLFAA